MDSGTFGMGVEMSRSTVTLYIGIAIGLLFMIGAAILFWKMQKIRKESHDIFSKRYSPGDIICHDNFAEYFGLESFEGKQVRGKGVLVLTEKELYFLRLHPKMELCIPLKKIKSCVTPSSFLGKSINKPFLKIEFQDETGALNSVAWHVADLKTFVTALKLQRKQNRSKKRA